MFEGKSKGIIGNIIMLVIGLILIIAVALPVTISVMSGQNATMFTNYNTGWVVMNLFPLFIVLTGLVMIAGFLMSGKR
jgi:hypothetical protein